MRLSEIPLAGRDGLLVVRNVAGAGPMASEPGEYAAVRRSQRIGDLEFFEANVGGAGLIACDPEEWDVIPTQAPRAAGTVAFEFMIASQESRSGVDGFLMALNLVRKRGLPRP